MYCIPLMSCSLIIDVHPISSGTRTVAATATAAAAAAACGAINGKLLPPFVWAVCVSCTQQQLQQQYQQQQQQQQQQRQL